MNLSFPNLMGGLIFSGIGFIAFTYGKRMGSARLMVLGGVLMIYSYFVPNTAMVYLVGLGLTAAVYLFRE